MNRIKAILLGAGLAAAAGGWSGAAQATTTILDFSGAICGESGTSACSNSARIGQNYGDSAGMVSISYRSLNSTTQVTYEDFLKYWSTGYGDLTGVAWGGGSATGYISEILFTPAPGMEIALLGFQAGCYQNRSSCQTVNYTVQTLGGDAIASGSASTLYPGHATVAVNSGYFSDGIRLHWGPDGYDVGLDQIGIDVRALAAPVPEPASWAMMIAGFGIAGIAMRRRSGLRAQPSLAA